MCAHNRARALREVTAPSGHEWGGGGLQWGLNRQRVS